MTNFFYSSRSVNYHSKLFGKKCNDSSGSNFLNNFLWLSIYKKLATWHLSKINSLQGGRGGRRRRILQEIRGRRKELGKERAR